MNGRVQRDAAEQTCGRITEAIGGDGVRCFVDRQRKNEDDESDENCDEVDVGEQAVPAYYSAATNGSGAFPIALAPRPAYCVSVCSEGGKL